MSLTSTWERIVFGSRGADAPWRALLWCGAIPYRAGIALRNFAYDAKRPARLPVPVISVGNLTCGGTGKTPMVIDIAARLAEAGRRPAVVARGYGGDRPDVGKAGPEQTHPERTGPERTGPERNGAQRHDVQPFDPHTSDEERLIRRRLPFVPYVAHADRVAAGLRAVNEHHADAVVLDDGFQHRRLHRDLDVVLLDATRPFGGGHLLPRGMLREPPASLRRAGLVVLTRCDQADDHDLEALEETVARYAPDAPRLRCRHRVTGLSMLDGAQSADTASGMRALLLAGIAHPQAFAATARDMCVDVTGVRAFPDHHRYDAGEIEALLASTSDTVLTTEKDAVKIATLPGIDHERFRVVTVRIDFERDDGRILDELLDRTLKEHKPT